MTDYTEDDFKNARLAVRGQIGVARRVDLDDTRPWFAPAYERQEWLTDADMAAHGWKPVAEEVSGGFAREMKIKEQDAVIDDLNARLESKREIVDVLTARIREMTEERTAPLTLDDLEAAWDVAKAGTMHHDGDVVIVRIDEDEYVIRQVDGSGHLPKNARILARNEREPWADLADVLREDRLAFEEDVEGIARRLYERGFRVTGGDDDE